MEVVVGGNVLHHVKREGELSGRVKVQEGEYARVGKCPGEMPYSRSFWPGGGKKKKMNNKYEK